LTPDVVEGPDGIGALLARFLGAYCLKKVRHDSTVLHYRRTPTWKSLVLFVGEWSKLFHDYSYSCAEVEGSSEARLHSYRHHPLKEDRTNIAMLR